MSYNKGLRVMVDIKIYDDGSIIGFLPVTDKAREWIDDNILDDPPYLGNMLCVERRYAGDIDTGMRESGLVLERV